ncbi:MAG: FAD:protein FMN transferase [Methylococcales bacterium]|nr:FAD:protein FMN transferase [Methylococcales bacterium]
MMNLYLKQIPPAPLQKGGDLKIPFLKGAGGFALIFLLTSCEQAKPVQKFEGYTQGTTYHISFWSTQKNVDTSTLQQAVDTELKRLDEQLSNYRDDSVIEKFNALNSTEPQEIGAEIVDLIEKTRLVSEASHGCYDLTIKPLFDLWGFKGESLTKPTPIALQQALTQVGFSQLETTDLTHFRKRIPNLKLDLSSIGQGYSVSQIAKILEREGADNYLVEIGGELQTRGKKPDGSMWRVALEKPLSSERSMHKIITINRSEPFAVTTSGTYRHFFDSDGKRYSHILDAKTGSPVSHQTVSVTVFHDDATIAELWDTALLCLGREKGIEAANQAGIAALFIEQQGDTFNEFNTTALDKLKASNTAVFSD